MPHSTTLDRDLTAGGARYRLLVRTDSRDALARELAALDADRLLVVTDPSTPRALAARLGPYVFPVRHDTTLQTVEQLAERAMAAGADRRSVVVGVGGRTAVDTAGLLAAMLFQGLRLVQVPTTLAAMCDAALSPWHAVSSGVLGAWYAPESVFCPLDALRPETIAAGLVEPIRSVLAVCPGSIDGLRTSLDAGSSPRALASFIALCADARATATAFDPLERGPGRVLEYGRTLGRAVRLLCGQALVPGAADGLGLLLAARISGVLGLLSHGDELVHRELLSRAGLPLALPADLDPGALASALRLADGRRGRTGLVLLDGLGSPHCTGGSLLTEVDEETVRLAVHTLRPHAGIPHERGESSPESARLRP